MSIITVLFSRWIAALHSLYPPKRIRLGLSGLLDNPLPSTERVRFVLCWLKGDGSGVDTAAVEQALSVVEGIEVRRSFRIVEAGGGADEWRPAMREQARRVLKDWNADLAIVGVVKVPGEALSLWIVPREGGYGTLASTNERVYPLDHATLQLDFREDLRTQITLWALCAAVPFADTEARGRVLEAGLKDGVRKTAVLLKGRTVDDGGCRASLHLALGNALQTLGERESEPNRLEQAVVAYQAALQEYTRERAPLDWAVTQNNLGAALAVLGQRESGTGRLEQAVSAYEAALQLLTRESTPLQWAATQNNLGAALAALGELKGDVIRLEQAVAAFEAALKERTRERMPLDWAATQHNFGNTLQILGERESGTARFERAIVAYEAALKERTRERVPLDWAMTWNNLGDSLAVLGKRENETGRLEQAVAAYEAALQELTRERVPLPWAVVQHHLGDALAALGERESGTARLEQAVAAYEAALEERTCERVPRYWAMTRKALDDALALLRERKTKSRMSEFHN